MGCTSLRFIVSFIAAQTIGGCLLQGIDPVLILTRRVSIPFFFEPNFDAHVKPLAAALRIQNGESGEKEYQPVVYGDFLLSKVSSNFDTTGKRDKY